ncbi:hypothetical protein LXA43DRAFT_878532, partial [Ganoderma leucocontextum]
MRDEDGHTFQVRVHFANPASAVDRAQARRNRLIRTPRRERCDTRVQAIDSHLLNPGTSKTIPVRVRFPKDSDSVYIEKLLQTRRNKDEFYGAPDSFVSKERPFLQVLNLTDSPIRIQKGEVLGHTRNPNTWLDKSSRFSEPESESIHTYASLICKLASDSTGSHANTVQTEAVKLKAAHRLSNEEDPLVEEPLEGGPKTSEAPPEDVPENELFASVDISKELDEEQREKIAEVVRRNKTAFSLNGRLGTVKARCTIPLRPGAKEISLPPFPSSSPAKREVM